MSISDRRYMDPTDESLDSPNRQFSATMVLIAINCVMWMVWRFGIDNPDILGAVLIKHFATSPSGVLDDLRLHTLVTSAFSHIEIWHLIGNMFFFWMLAEDVERIYGYRNMFVLYLFGALLAGMAHVGINFIHPVGVAIGASGAVMAVAVVAAIFDPKKTILAFGIIPVPLGALVIIYIVLDLIGGLDGNRNALSGGGKAIAHAAHLGGALGGFIFWKLDLRAFSSPGRESVGLIFRLKQFFRRRPKLRIVKKMGAEEEIRPQPVAQSGHATRAASAGASAKVDSATGQRVDQLLSKISQQGMNALTDEERTFLSESSKKYKKE